MMVSPVPRLNYRQQPWPACRFGGQCTPAQMQAKLWPQGIENTEFFQGKIPDCQLLTPIYLLSRHPEGRRILEEMITQKPGGQYEVTFKKYPHQPITVSSYEARKKRLPEGEDRTNQVIGDFGLRILEVAYARLMKTLNPRKYADVADNQIVELYNHKAYHSDENVVLKDITGWRGEDILFKKGQRIIAKKRDRALKMLERKAHSSHSYIVTAYSNLRSRKDVKHVDLGRKLSAWHVFGVEKVDLNDQTVYLRDPHNTQVGLSLRFPQFFKYFRGMVVSTVPKSR